MNEHCNDYVDDLCDLCLGLRDCLSSTLPVSVWEDAWNRTVEAGYLSMLEGFSYIHDCSTEGRALMSMDITTFFSTMDNHKLCSSSYVPKLSQLKGKHYVDTYIKVFYYPQEVCKLYTLRRIFSSYYYSLIKLCPFIFVSTIRMFCNGWKKTVLCIIIVIYIP